MREGERIGGGGENLSFGRVSVSKETEAGQTLKTTAHTHTYRSESWKKKTSRQH